MDKLKRYTASRHEVDEDQDSGEFVLYKDVAELEAKNAALEKRCAELEDQEDGYKRLVDALSECVVECKAGDGFYGNDPVEMIGDIGNRFDELKSELEAMQKETYHDTEM